MNRYFQEVLDAHELISIWLGSIDTPSTVCDSLLARFSSAFTMVTPAGHLLDYPALAAFFRQQAGAKLGLQIKIEAMQLIAEDPSGATVSYCEWQKLPNQQPTRRFSTVVFQLLEDQQIIWRHLHETALAE